MADVLLGVKNLSNLARLLVGSGGSVIFGWESGDFCQKLAEGGLGRWIRHFGRYGWSYPTVCRRINLHLAPVKLARVMTRDSLHHASLQ